MAEMVECIQYEVSHFYVGCEEFIGYLTSKRSFFRKFFVKTLADSKNSRTFASEIENESNQTKMVW